MATERVNNVIVVSDTHVGDRGGLCPPEGLALDQGGSVNQSNLQKIMWRWWREFWDEWVPNVCHGEPFAVVVNGDALEGRHHGSTHQASQNLADQWKAGLAVFRPIVELCGGRFYMVRGTEAHVGQSAEDEERLAAALGAIPDEFGCHCRSELKLVVGGKARVNLMHHIGTTGTSHYESTAVLKELIESYVEAGTWGDEPYDAVVRSHRHRYLMIARPSHRGYAFSMVTPGWQLKTPFTYKIPGGRMARPQFGGVLLRQGDEDFFHRAFVRSIKPPKEVLL